MATNRLPVDDNNFHLDLFSRSIKAAYRHDKRVSISHNSDCKQTETTERS